MENEHKWEEEKKALTFDNNVLAGKSQMQQKRIIEMGVQHEMDVKEAVTRQTTSGLSGGKHRQAARPAEGGDGIRRNTADNDSSVGVATSRSAAAPTSTR